MMEQPLIKLLFRNKAFSATAALVYSTYADPLNFPDNLDFNLVTLDISPTEEKW